MRVVCLILILCFTIGVSGCVSNSPKSDKKTAENVAPDVTSHPASQKSEESTTVEVKRDVLFYFYSLYPRNSGKPVKGLQIDDEFKNEGYLKVTGNMEGYLIFDLFRGKNQDYVIEQVTGCGPECDQKFKMHIFKAGKLVESQPLQFYYAEDKLGSHIEKMKSSLPRNATGEELQSWLRLPKSGTSIEVLIVDQNPGSTTGKVAVYKVANLVWNGERFDLKTLNPQRPSTIKISEVQ